MRSRRPRRRQVSLMSTSPAPSSPPGASPSPSAACTRSSTSTSTCAGPAGRPDRPQRRRQDDLHRRDHRASSAAAGQVSLDGQDISALAAARPRPPRARPHLAVDRALRRPDRAREPRRRRLPPDRLCHRQGDALAPGPRERAARGGPRPASASSPTPRRCPPSSPRGSASSSASPGRSSPAPG